MFKKVHWVVGPVYQTLKLALLKPPGMSFQQKSAVSLAMLSGSPPKKDASSE